jgi:hypothetical protein
MIEDRLNEALTIIADGLYIDWQKFGRQDFPRDAGVSFRNEFIKFPNGFIDEVKNPVRGDEAVAKNIALLEKLTAQQLVRIIGILHFYITTWDACTGKISQCDFRKALDWIFNAYGFPASASIEWFEIAKRNTDELALPEGQQKMYSEIAAILDADPKDTRSAGSLSGLAFVIKHGHVWDEAAHAEWCRQVFES